MSNAPVVETKTYAFMMIRGLRDDRHVVEVKSRRVKKLLNDPALKKYVDHCIGFSFFTVEQVNVDGKAYTGETKHDKKTYFIADIYKKAAILKKDGSLAERARINWYDKTHVFVTKDGAITAFHRSDKNLVVLTPNTLEQIFPAKSSPKKTPKNRFAPS